MRTAASWVAWTTTRPRLSHASQTWSTRLPESTRARWRTRSGPGAGNALM